VRKRFQNTLVYHMLGSNVAQEKSLGE